MTARFTFHVSQLKIVLNSLRKYANNHEYFMASLDVESLFTNIPLEETIKICCDSLYKNQELLCNISKNQFLRAVLGVAMGSPLGPSLANAF